MGSLKWLWKLALICASVVAVWLIGSALRSDESEDTESAYAVEVTADCAAAQTE
ncbi:MAG: hypothetical protein IJ329_05060 [Clostridia bacterium]|nr:hypothetical protein [Clostridia bacterium]MBQ7924654.1 hypothetical protein [Clostridia bacterium]